MNSRRWLDVYNDANEKQGDINELIIDKDGKVSAVVIGEHPWMPPGEWPRPPRQLRRPGKTHPNDWVPDHAVMSSMKDQLKAMPQFKYSDYN